MLKLCYFKMKSGRATVTVTVTVPLLAVAVDCDNFLKEFDSEI